MRACTTVSWSSNISGLACASSFLIRVNPRTQGYQRAPTHTSSFPVIRASERRLIITLQSWDLPVPPQQRRPDSPSTSTGSVTDSPAQPSLHDFSVQHQQHLFSTAPSAPFDLSDPLFWATAPSIDTSHFLLHAPPEIEPAPWSCSPFSANSLAFDFSSIQQPASSGLDLDLELDLDQFLAAPPGSVSPALSVELTQSDNDGNVMGTFPPTGVPPTIPVTSGAHHSSSSSLLPGLTSKSRRQSPPDSPPDQDILVKRHRNNLAAKKYRQKKFDRIKELEDEVAEVKAERDELRIRLARQEAETAALREMLAGKLGKPGDSSDH